MPASPLFSDPAIAEPVPLYLEAIVNDHSTGLIAAFTQDDDGMLAATADELAQVGIRTAPGEADGRGQVPLARLSGVTYRYDEVAQVIAITASADRLLPHVFDAGRSPAAVAADAGRPARGAVLNYSAFGAAGGGDTVFSTLLDGWVFGSAGVLEQSGFVRVGDSKPPGFVRLNTTWTTSTPDSLVTYRAGDVISGGLEWTRPVRLGGLQVQRDFTLRPDLVTMPLPAFSGSAAVPSTVEIYANGAQLFSEDVQPGPFTITGVPVVSGVGTARIVVRDALGRSTETNEPFFASSSLLRKGLVDFSLEAGFPRRSYGVESADYAATPAASATLRTGLSDRVTVEVHGEVTAGLLNGGVGLVTPIGNRGMARAAVAASGGDHSGVLANLGLQLRFGRLRLRLRTMRTFGDYADIAAVSAVGGLGSAAPRAIDQLTLAVPLHGHRASLALAYAATRTDSANHAVASLTYSRRLSDKASLYVTGYRSLTGDGDGLFFGLSRTLGGKVVASSNASARDGEIGARFNVSRAEAREPGSVGWRLAGGLGDDPNWRAAASASATIARFSASLRGTKSGISTSGEISGAIVAAGGEVFLSRRVDDAFAVVDTGAPGVAVYAENRPVGHTDKRGKLLVTGLRGWETNRLSIDVDELPMTDSAARTSARVVPAGRSGIVVDFGVTSGGDTAVVVIRDADGSFPPVGTAGTLVGGGMFVVGYDGQAFVGGLGARNTIELAFADGNTCRADFSFAPPADAIQPLIDGVTCQ